MEIFNSLDDVKQKLTDKEYLDLMNQVSDLVKKSHVTPEPLRPFCLIVDLRYSEDDVNFKSLITYPLNYVGKDSAELLARIKGFRYIISSQIRTDISFYSTVKRSYEAIFKIYYISDILRERYTRADWMCLQDTNNDEDYFHCGSHQNWMITSMYKMTCIDGIFSFSVISTLDDSYLSPPVVWS